MAALTYADVVVEFKHKYQVHVAGVLTDMILKRVSLASGSVATANTYPKAAFGMSKIIGVCAGSNDTDSEALEARTNAAGSAVFLTTTLTVGANAVANAKAVSFTIYGYPE